MNNKGVFTLFGWFMVLLLIGGGIFAWLYYKDFDVFKVSEEDILNQTNVSEVERCEVCNFPDIDKIAYYFDNQTYKGINVFMDNTNSYLYCGLTSLEDEDFASRFIALHNTGRDVRIHLGIEDTMISCETTCIPKLESQYNYLLGEGVSISYGRLNFNFCVNSKAVYIFSLAPGSISKQDHGLIIFNKQLKEKYENYFKKIAD